MKLLLHLIIILLCACTSHADSPTPHSKLEYLDLVEIDSLYLNASNAYNYDNLHGMSVASYNGQEYLLNLSNERIFRFDLNDGELVEEFPLPREGKGSIKVAGDGDGIAMIKPGHYLYIANMMRSIYSVKSNFASIVDRTADADNVYLVSSYQGLPLTIGSASIIPQISHNYKDISQNKAFRIIDHETWTSKQIIDYPGIYKQQSYGLYPYLYHASIINFESKGELKFCVSFPVDQKVHIYNSNFTLEESHYMQSNEIDEIPAFSDLYYVADQPDQTDHTGYYNSLSYYTGLYYDSKNEIFYRLAKIHVPEKDGWPFKYSIVAFDKEFKAIGESTVPDHYKPSSAFGSKFGLMMLNRKKFANDRSSAIPYSILSIQ